MKFLKKHIDKILIFVGIVIMMTALPLAYRWKSAQEKMLYKDNVSKNVEIAWKEDIESLGNENELQFEEESTVKIDNTENKNISVNRDEYVSGMMVINIEKLDVRAAVVEGTTRELLKEGPGLYEISPLPDEEGGNVCIAGHRTTYGAWFRHVDDLVEGDEIILEYNDSKYVYKVEGVFIVDKKDWSVTKPVRYSVLTLTACHPLRSDKQRIVVRAKLEKN